MKKGKEKQKKIKRTLSPTCELISTTFCVASPPYLTAFSVALLAILVAEEDKNDQPLAKDDIAESTNS
jgi:hypothetical protein